MRSEYDVHLATWPLLEFPDEEVTDAIVTGRRGVVCGADGVLVVLFGGKTSLLMDCNVFTGMFLFYIILDKE